MNILQINKYHYFRGGSETVFLNMIDLLRDNGHKVAPFSVVHPKNLPSEYDRFFVNAPEMRDLSTLGKIKSLPRFFYNREAADNLQKLIDEFKPDVAHLHNIFNGLSLSILPVLYRNNIPVVITIHDSRFICPTIEFDNKSERCRNCLKTGGLSCGIHRCFEGSTLNSWMMAFEMLHKEYLLDYDRYIDRYHFVSRRFIENYAQRHEYFRDKGTVFYQYLPTLDSVEPEYNRGRYMLYYGRITEEKGITTVLEAMKLCPEIKLNVGGTGPMYESLKSLRIPNVEFLGFLRGKELEDVVKGSSFVIVPSQWEENNPMSVCESYSFGKPVIVSDRVSEFVDDNSGFLFKEKDVEGLAEVIRKADSVSQEEYRRLAHGARQFAESKFYNREGYTAQLLKLYEDTIESHRQRKK